MNMNKKILILLLMAFCFLTADAQWFATICGTEFRVELNKQNRTATIVDYSYEVDDAEFPFYSSRKLKKPVGRKLVIPDVVTFDGVNYTVTGIGYAAFADFRNIDYVDIPETVLSIGDYAFFHSSLREVTVPGSVLSIGDRAFARCDKLKRLELPQDIALGDRVYSDGRKDLVLNTYVNLAQTEKKKEDKPVIITSDIDQNIPTTTLRAENTFAIIIANENYQHDPEVDFALRDGRTFRTYCRQVLGLPDENIRMQENATLNNMRALVNWIANVAEAYGGDARILFYYSGHGVPDEDGNTNLLPVDGTAKDPSTGYSLRALYAELGGLDAHNVCVFLDACFSGKQRNDDMLVAARGVRRAKEEMPKGNMVVFSASKEDETAHAYPEKGHGLFTYFLCKKLQETKGEVTLGELADYIEDNVLKRSVVSLNMTQTPVTSSSPALSGSWRDLDLR